GRRIILWDDGRVIPLRPGATILFPAGTKRFSFMPVGQNETRYMFRQYFHSSVMRWVEKGGRSDTEFDSKANADEDMAWKLKREGRAKAAVKTFCKLDEV
ncbi:hypothetical protein B0H19DRAFT_907829, partial [Mycena capillaripes]